LFGKHASRMANASLLILSALVSGAMCNQAVHVMRKEQPSSDGEEHVNHVRAAKVAGAAASKAVADAMANAKISMASLEAYKKSHTNAQTVLLGEGHQDKDSQHKVHVIRQDDVAGVAPSLVQVASEPAAQSQAMGMASDAFKNRMQSKPEHKSALKAKLDQYNDELKDARHKEYKEFREQKAAAEAGVKSPSLLASTPQMVTNEKVENHQGAGSGLAATMGRAEDAFRKKMQAKPERKSALQERLDQFKKDSKAAKHREFKEMKANQKARKAAEEAAAKAKEDKR